MNKLGLRRVACPKSHGQEKAEPGLKNQAGEEPGFARSAGFQSRSPFHSISQSAFHEMKNQSSAERATLNFNDLRI